MVLLERMRSIMSNQESLTISLLDDFSTSGAGYDVLRYISLPDLLGDESETILYFMGKNLARKLTFESLEDVSYIFNRLDWGQLELIKEKRKHLIFHLMSDAVVRRIQAPIHTDFRLEAGFLAEAMEQLLEKPCECTENVNNRLHLIEFKVVFTD